VEAEKLQEAEAAVERMQGLVSKYTKDFLQLKHDALQREREEKETVEALRIDARQARAALEKAKEAATLELQQHSSSAKASSEQYVALFRQQARAAGPTLDPDPDLDSPTRTQTLTITRARARTPSLPTDPNPDYCPRP